MRKPCARSSVWRRRPPPPTAGTSAHPRRPSNSHLNPTPPPARPGIRERHRGLSGPQREEHVIGMRRVVIGSRKSPLAMTQSRMVRDMLLELDPALEVTIEE